MTNNRIDLTEEIITLALNAKEIADKIGELKNSKSEFFTKKGKNKLNTAYFGCQKASVILMESSFEIDLHNGASAEILGITTHASDTENDDQEFIFNGVEVA
jgi:hypothetical protein